MGMAEQRIKQVLAAWSRYRRSNDAHAGVTLSVFVELVAPYTTSQIEEMYEND